MKELAKPAIEAVKNGASAIRINPGNIGGEEKLRAVVEVAKEKNVPIRVGVNSGSLEKELVEKYGGVTAQGIVESALDKVHMIEDAGYGAYFGHSFGHSLGLYIHEQPSASPGEKTVMPVGAVISAEPGIYIPGKFGVRIEDVLILREDGCEDITHAEKNLIILK